MPGEVAHTPAFNLDAKYITHTIGLSWVDGKLVGDIEEYIDEHSADAIQEAEYGGRSRNERYERLERLEAYHSAMMADSFEDEEPEEEEAEDLMICADAAAPSFPDVSGKSLDEVLDSSEDTFQQRLFKLIDENDRM